jgi:3',5'-cyclic AMP phosphodiesterase CpdA
MRTIAHISDVHFGRTDPAVVEGLVQDLSSRHPSVLVVSGDFTQRARARQYRAAAEFLKRLPTPQLVVPGNHDIPLYDIIRRFFFPLNRYRKYITKDLRPVYQDEELFVLGINTAVVHAQERLDLRGAVARREDPRLPAAAECV